MTNHTTQYIHNNANVHWPHLRAEREQPGGVGAVQAAVGAELGRPEPDAAPPSRAGLELQLRSKACAAVRADANTERRPVE